ncbi:hypothetical protein [Candidatus Tachikawaea gelatinosa]|uniref:hypothetical protein n=1 Tax=Candidatus Tachikawaea gelatinosa TaxID=1410383 RepID=UPI0006941C06|nr:hypothetical protein [Candidatus Tachikawaea gelatinosa]
MNKEIFKLYPKKPIALGEIKSSYGIYGWVKLCSWTEKKKIYFFINLGLLNIRINGKIYK